MHKTTRVAIVLVGLAMLFGMYALYRVERTHVRLSQTKEQLAAEQRKAEQQKAPPSGAKRGSPRP